MDKEKIAKNERVSNENEEHEHFESHVHGQLDSCIEEITNMNKAFYAENYVGYLRAYHRAMVHLISVKPDDVFTKDGLPIPNWD